MSIDVFLTVKVKDMLILLGFLLLTTEFSSEKPHRCVCCKNMFVQAAVRVRAHRC